MRGDFYCQLIEKLHYFTNEGIRYEGKFKNCIYSIIYEFHFYLRKADYGQFVNPRTGDFYSWSSVIFAVF
jgi:hypothetical protein